MEERNASFFRFEDLRIYAKAVDYAQWVLDTLGTPSTSEADRTFVKHFCRSAFDISLNIAEGSSRNKSQFEHYLKIAKTALRECVVFTAIAAKRGTLNAEQEDYSRTQLMELTRMIGALIISLQRGPRVREEGSVEDLGEEYVETNFKTDFPDLDL